NSPSPFGVHTTHENRRCFLEQLSVRRPASRNSFCSALSVSANVALPLNESRIVDVLFAVEKGDEHTACRDRGGPRRSIAFNVPPNLFRGPTASQTARARGSSVSRAPPGAAA